MVAGGRAMSERSSKRSAVWRKPRPAVVDAASFWSILAGAHIEDGAAPSLPADFISSINGLPVGAEWGPCAMAAALNEKIVAADIGAEPQWSGAWAWCQIALALGLRSCWATPIASAAEQSAGNRLWHLFRRTEPSRPATSNGSSDQFTNIASIAVERAQSLEALKLSESRKAAILHVPRRSIASVTIDHNGRITEFNPAAERTFLAFCARR